MLVGLLAASGGILVAGIAVMAAAIASPMLPPSLDISIAMNPPAAFFLSVGLICLGLLFLIGNIYLTKFIGTVQYLKFNFKIIKGVYLMNSTFAPKK